ncbi:hypothetical protein PUNSTDRAFT_81418 [Punctularia strigosozonata HHB-11173 SS5]|uniref:uncharacterized protein n=1 Tax=Punctularia strigosozonata (strain HHB-11173) TaxID=741275 RepID=UPI0004416E96|nr:uncharacterized protein PUNSTDRAFT_81418 [Punctularia strigosozonata HHB-11173 SS5]EIN12213.1 hypothetical protein PUNSTDRAFT_81418 [Punctularia strigosozonata HHB-11173 SS5]
MGQFDSSLGAILIGTWVDCMLYMWEIAQIYHCFKHFPHDRRSLKATIWLLFLVDTVGTAAGNGTAYLYMITYWGDMPAISKQYWTFPTYCLATACSAIIVQFFLLYRFWNLSRNHFITGFMSLLGITALVGAIYTSFTLVKEPNLSQRARVVTPVTIWFASSAACDVLIAVSLVWQFQRVRSPSRSTKTMLSKLTGMAIRTGSITSLFALLVLGTFLHDPQGSIAVGINSCLGRIYALTMMYNLNTRTKIRLAAVSRNTANHGPTVTAGVTGLGFSQFRVDTEVVTDYEPAPTTDQYQLDQTTLGEDDVPADKPDKVV